MEEEKLQMRAFNAAIPSSLASHSHSSPVTYLSRSQVTVSVKVEEVSSDKVQPTGALREPGDCWVEQPKLHHADRSVEEAGQRETLAPQGKPPPVPKEEPPPHQESGEVQDGAGCGSDA